MAEDRTAARRFLPGLWLGALLALTAAAFAPSLSGPFVLDDWPTIEGNMRLRQPDALRAPSLPDLLGANRPLTEATFVVDWRAAGAAPFRFRLVGLLLHLVAVVAAFAWLSRLASRVGHPRPRGVALAVAAAFALHPIQMDAVAYVSQRSEVLSALLSLVALLLLDEAARRWRTLAGTVAWLSGTITWVAAMGAKTVAIAVPGIFLLDQVALAPPGERAGRSAGARAVRAISIAAPLLVLAGWAATLQLRTFAEHPEAGAGFTATTLTSWQYLVTQFRVQWLYLALLFWPTGFAFDRLFEPSLSLDPGAVVAGLGIAALLAVASWLLLRSERRPGPDPVPRLAAFGILLWFVALSPTSTVVPLKDLAVEHRVYLACLGPFLVAAVLGDLLLHRWLAPRAARLAGMGTTAAVALALAALLHSRAVTWGSAEGFWQAAAASSPASARILTNYALALQKKGDLAAADAVYRRAWAVARDPERIARVAGNHAAMLLDARKPAEALAVSNRALAIISGDGGVLVNRAIALGMLGRPAEALVDARRAVAASPRDPRMHNVLGQALVANGDMAGALQAFRSAGSLDPVDPTYPASAAACLAALGRRDEACATLADLAARTRARPLPRDAAGRAAALGCPIR